MRDPPLPRLLADKPGTRESQKEESYTVLRNITLPPTKAHTQRKQSSRKQRHGPKFSKILRFQCRNGSGLFTSEEAEVQDLSNKTKLLGDGVVSLYKLCTLVSKGLQSKISFWGVGGRMRKSSEKTNAWRVLITVNHLSVQCKKVQCFKDIHFLFPP